MIERYTRDVGQHYYNVLELGVSIVVDEYFSVMEKLGLYTVDKDKYNLRRMFWFVVGGGAIVSALLPGYLAIGVYLYKHLG